jgi:hypothetical protein
MEYQLLSHIYTLSHYDYTAFTAFHTAKAGNNACMCIVIFINFLYLHTYNVLTYFNKTLEIP